MYFQIIPAKENDLPDIFRLFDEAIRFQEKNNYAGWKLYDEAFVRRDVENGELFKIMDAGNMVCIFSICYTDALIWQQRERGDALYLHRIILNRQFAGQKIFHHVLSWAIEHARDKGLRYVRMDTWADNEKLISYYKSYGFRFIENYTTANTKELPPQNRNLKVALLEYALM